MVRGMRFSVGVAGMFIACFIALPMAARAADPVVRPMPSDSTEQDLALLRTLGMPQGVLLRATSLDGIPASLRGNFPSIPAGSSVVFFDNSYSRGYIVVGSSWIYFDNSRPESDYAAALATAHAIPSVNRAIRSLGIPIPPGRVQIRPSVDPRIPPLQEEGGFIHTQPGMPQTPDTIFFSARPENIPLYLGHETTHRALGHDPGDPDMLTRCRLASFPLCELMPAVTERVLGFDHAVMGEFIGLALSLDYARDAHANPANQRNQFGDWLRSYLTDRNHEYTPYTYAFTRFLVDELYDRLVREGVPQDRIPAEIQRRLTAAAGARDAASVALALGFPGNRWRDPFAVMGDALFARLETWRTNPDPQYGDFQDQMRMLREQMRVQIGIAANRRMVPLLPGQAPLLRLPGAGSGANPALPGFMPPIATQPAVRPGMPSLPFMMPRTPVAPVIIPTRVPRAF